MAKPARQLALDILLKMERDSAYSNLAIAGMLDDSIPQQEKALVSALVYGVLERRLSLDYFLGRHLKQPLKKLKPEVLCILRLGVYQILFLDKIPARAAINESVNLTKKNRCGFASGLVNAVLRNVERTGLQMPETATLEEAISIRYSCPAWLVSLWLTQYGEEDTIAILKDALGRPPLTIRMNPLKTDAQTLMARLTDAGIEAETAALPHAFHLKQTGAIEALSAYQDGFFHVQDLASQLCIKALDVKPGDRVLDLCAAPGGKSFTAAEEMLNEGELIACDLYEQRVKLIEDGSVRLGVRNLKAVQNDAKRFNPAFGLFDKVLCDVPCSGLGILRKKPEIKEKLPEEIDSLPNLQYAILEAACQYIKESGRLIYSTCTLNRAENEAVVERFLQEHPDFTEGGGYPAPKVAGRPFLTLMPHRNGTDGFFIAILEKKRGHA